MATYKNYLAYYFLGAAVTKCRTPDDFTQIYRLTVLEARHSQSSSQQAGSFCEENVCHTAKPPPPSFWWLLAISGLPWLVEASPQFLYLHMVFSLYAGPIPPFYKDTRKLDGRTSHSSMASSKFKYYICKDRFQIQSYSELLENRTPLYEVRGTQVNPQHLESS